MSVGNSQNQKKGDQYVVDGAIFKCQYGSAPCQIAAQGQKVMAQGKPVVNDKDTTFKVASSPFISCTQNPNKQAPICQYAKGVWVPNSTVKQGKQNAITESSKMKCPIFGGEISCVFPGQTQGVSAADFNNVEMEMLSNFPFALVVTFPSFDKEKKKAAAVYHVSVSKNTVRPGETVTLHALDKKKNELTIYDRVNWALSTTKEVKENKANKVAGGTYLDRLVIFKHMSTPFDIKLREPGKYIIEGGSDGMLDNGYYRIDANKPLVKNNIIPRDKDCAATVEVLEHNRILDYKIVGDYAIDPNDKSRYLLKKSEDIKIVVRTVFPLKEDERLHLFVNNYLTSCVAQQQLVCVRKEIDTDRAEYSFTVTPSIINSSTDKQIGIVLTEGKVTRKELTNRYSIQVVPNVGKDVVDSIHFAIKKMNGFISANVSLDKNGEKEVPAIIRPDTTIYLTLSSAGKSVDITGLDKAIWTLKNGKFKSIFTGYKSGLYLHMLKYEGETTVSLDLSKCDFVINRDKKAIYNASYSFKVSRNKIVGVNSSTPKVFYPGINHHVVFDLLYGEYNNAADKPIIYYLDEKETELTSNGLDITFDKGDIGHHTINYNEGKFEFEVRQAEVEKWAFVDGKGNRISEVGFEENFYLEIDIPAWKYVKDKDKALSKIRMSIWDTKNSRRINYSSSNAKFNADGHARMELTISKEEFKGEKREKISIIASISNLPYTDVKGLIPMHGQNGEWVCSTSSPLTLVTTPTISGFFAGKSGNPQKSVMKYGDSVYIMLATHNCQEQMDKISVVLYENNKIGDDDAIAQFKDGDPEFDADKGRVKIDLSGKFTDESAHGENPNPRLFYFKVYLDGKAVYTYPLTPADIYADKTKFFESPVDIQGASYAKSTPADVFDMDVEKEVEALSITKETDADDVEKSKKERFGSYLWQLKIGKDKEIERLNRSLTMMAPVVVGEELRKGEKSLGDYRCPRCNEEAEDLKKRLKEMFCGAKDGDISIIAETYCKYQRLLHMDSCWIKAHFFAQAAVESTHLTEFTERLNYTTKKRLHEVFDSSVFKQKGTKKVEQKLNEIFDETRTSTKEDRKKKIAMLIYGERPNDLGNNTEEDGWTYRGRGLVQITGKAAYEKVGKILLCLGLDKDGIECDLVNNPDLVASDLRLATVASMAFFRYKGCNMYNLCNGNENTYLVSNAVGGFDKPKKQTAFDGKYKTDDGKEKQKEKHTKGVFDVDHCDWKKIKFTGVVPSYHTFSNGRVEKHIPKGCDEKTVDHYEFYYHKEDGSCVKICERTIVREGLWKLGKITEDVREPKGVDPTWTYEKKEGSKISGKAIYVMDNGDKIVVGSKGVWKYPKIGDGIELVKIDEDKDGLFQFEENGLKLYYRIKTDQTARCYSSPNVFAIFIGILAELGTYSLNEIKSVGTGNTERHGTGYPSRSHKNGVAFDFSYNDVGPIDLEVLKAAYKFKCKTVYVGKETHPNGFEGYATARSDHENHIHIGPLDERDNEPLIIRE